MTKKLRAIITGSTGMVGEGVLIECLNHPDVEKVLVINRKPCGYTHPKLKEIIHANFFNLQPIADQLTGYNACFFCAGITSVGKSKEEYYHFTYNMTMAVAQVLVDANPDMVFCYVSGASTDSTEHGSLAWARVKGKTENDLMKMSFKEVYNFRPGFMLPTKGMKYAQPFYKYINWLFPVLKMVAPNSVSTLQEQALAMINAPLKGYDKQILEVPDIKKLAAK
jgi:uncharacterized protein YbjT (DUF2867 family)